MARRLARNTQSILLEESHLAKVSDPAAGSGAIEDMTEQLCGAAWILFQQIEGEGGLPAALASGLVQAKVADVRVKRMHAVARRIHALTGTSEFPHLAEVPVQVLAPSPLAPPHFRGRSRAEGHREGVTGPVGENRPPPHPSPLQGEGAEAASLAPIRLSAPFEQLRDASDAHFAATGKRPQIFLANLGGPFDFMARATFAKNLFEAGGIEAISNDGFADPDALAAAFRASGATLVCLCSSDPIYADQAIAAVEALTASGAKAIYLAGSPGPSAGALQAAGVKSFVYNGCDVLAVLQRAHDIIGMTAGAPG
jgi:methylmalonyl-CoA mutase